MIDEKKLLKDINGMWKGYDFLPVDRFVDVIENQPKIGTWIPCSERLPEEDGFYWATLIRGDHSTLKEYYDNLKNANRYVRRIEFRDGRWRMMELVVLAWMTCNEPEPYNPNND